MMDVSRPDDATKSAIRSAYRTIDKVSYKGRRAIEATFTESEIKTIEEYSEYNGYDYTNQITLRYYGDLNGVDITEYNRIYDVDMSEEYSLSTSIIKLTIDDAEGKSESIKVDLYELTSWAVANYNKRNSNDFTLDGRQKVKIDDKRDLYITSFWMDFDQKSKNITELSAHGYILERN